MAEHIDRNELIENLKKFAPEHYTDLIHQLITKQPSAEVEEVKRGEWISDRCTNCEKLNPTLDFNEYLMRYYSFYLPRCPYCGAYMKKE